MGGELHRLVGDVALARRHLEQLPVDGGPVLADEDDLAVVGDGHDDHRAGMVDDVALEGGAVGVGEGADAGGDERPLPDDLLVELAESRQRNSRSDVGGVELEQVGRPALGSGQGGGHERLKERMGAGGAALELGMGLGADPERVAGELDELDQPVVG